MKSTATQCMLPIFTAIASGCLIAIVSLTAQAEPIDASAESSREVVTTGESGAVAAPLSERFADSGATEIPDFQKHVIPLMGRLGCNGRACHGSFQGRGGFQLSLFGYDFSTDHAALLDESSGRVDLDDVDESLILAKPLDADMHEGGQRFDSGSWQHHVLRRWIESGAEFDGKSPQQLVRLEVTPAEIQFTTENEAAELRAVAHWEDGSAEDVTALCRFSSNDDSIADVDENGKVHSGVSGDTHVVIYYDNAVIPVPVLRPVSSKTRFSDDEPTQEIDRLVQLKLRKLGIQPSGQCTDSEFIRRVSLDMTGILPASDQVRAFLEDDSPNKRERLVEELLASPGYAAWWATRFSDWTGNSDEQLNNVLPIRNAATRLWYEWLRVRLADNMPYDKIIEGIVTAQSRQPDESYTDYCSNMTEACEPGNEQMFAERDGMPLFWARRNFQKPEERAIGFAYTFLGVRIECAQCHKHPFDRWSKDDFEQFAKLFAPIRLNQNLVSAEAKAEREAMLQELTGDKKLKGGDLRRAITKAAQKGQTVPFGELLVNTRPISDRARKVREQAKKKGRKVAPLNIPRGTILGQAESLELNRDPRGDLMQWLRAPENPYFSKAIVNRVWSNYFGAGIVDPTDDMNLANPPVNAALMDYLAAGLIENDFDLKWLHREIVQSDTYQRSSDTNETNVSDRTNFSHHVPRRLPAEVVYDAVRLATGSDKNASQLRGELDEMAIADGKPRRRNQQDFALSVFGQSIRESNCDCDRSDAPSLLQSIYLRNDSDMHKRLADKDGWVAQACKALGVPGPSVAADPKSMMAQRRADGPRKQFLKLVARFKAANERQQAKMRPQLRKEYQRVTSKIEQAGFVTPPLASLLNGSNTWSELEDGTPATAATVTMESLVEEAYLRTLSRHPDPEETSISVSFIEESKSPAEGMQSLLWALVNTKEFIITH